MNQYSLQSIQPQGIGGIPRNERSDQTEQCPFDIETMSVWHEKLGWLTLNSVMLWKIWFGYSQKSVWDQDHFFLLKSCMILF